MNDEQKVLWIFILLVVLIICVPLGIAIKQNNNSKHYCNEQGYARFENSMCVGKIQEDGTINLSMAIPYQ